MKDYDIISIKDPKSLVTESYRRLQVNIEFSQSQRDNRVIMMTSTTQEEGKSLSILNLVSIYAESKAKVLLIDLDLRRPRIHRGLKLRNEKGLTTYLNGEMDQKDLITKSEYGFDVILAGKSVSSPTILLKSQKLKELFEQLRTQYDYIFVDTPPAGIVTDPFIISQLCDGVIYTVAAKKTKRDAIKETIKELKVNGANIIGINLTRAQMKDIKTQKYYYREYYDELKGDKE